MVRLGSVFVLSFAASAASISGTVFLKVGQNLKPCIRAEVMARAVSDTRVIQSSITDAQGHYNLPGIDGRFSVTVSFPGYVPRAAGGGGRAPLMDLEPNERLDNFDFELIPGGVITGRVTDQQGTPMDGVLVAVSPASRAADQNGPPIIAKTDDRGIYRVFGLETRRYLVFAGAAEWVGSGRPAETYYRDAGDPDRAEPVEVAAARVTSGIDLALKPAPVLRLSGKVAGGNPDDLPHVRIVAATAAGSPRASVSYSAPVERDAAFSFDLPAGPYTVTATLQPDGRIIACTKIDLSTNITGLLLQPRRPGRITGRVVFAAGQHLPPPREIHLHAADGTGVQSIEMAARAPEYRFDSGEIVPGIYKLELTSSRIGYVIKVADGSRSAGGETTVAEGTDTAVEIEMGLDRAQISGIVTRPSGSPVAHAKVAIAAAGRRPMKIQAIDADQKGRFILTDIVPGEYVLCAWTRIDEFDLDTPEIWQRAGDAVKRVKLMPNAAMDSTLMVAATPPGGAEQ
ncbi:MAG TPA: carboxypeptidase-like regulatory domain-containing protein [Bryobacteraceae bacterium]